MTHGSLRQCRKNWPWIWEKEFWAISTSKRIEVLSFSHPKQKEHWMTYTHSWKYPDGIYPEVLNVTLSVWICQRVYTKSTQQLLLLTMITEMRRAYRLLRPAIYNSPSLIFVRFYFDSDGKFSRMNKHIGLLAGTDRPSTLFNCWNTLKTVSWAKFWSRDLPPRLVT